MSAAACGLFYDVFSTRIRSAGRHITAKNVSLTYHVFRGSNMKAIKKITLAAATLLGVAGAVLYSSCAKDECGAIECLNHGTCRGGKCQCIPGAGGASCEILYRKYYNGLYKGLPPDDPKSDTTNALMFDYGVADSPYNGMDMTWIDTANLTVAKLRIDFTSMTTAGSTFSVVPSTTGGVSYSGNGSVTEHEATVQLKRRFTGGSEDMVYFQNYIKQ